MNEQRDNLIEAVTNGRASPVGREHWRLPGCHHAQVGAAPFNMERQP